MSHYYRNPLTEHMVTHKHDLKDGATAEPAGGDTPQQCREKQPQAARRRGLAALARARRREERPCPCPRTRTRTRTRTRRRHGRARTPSRAWAARRGWISIGRGRGRWRACRAAGGRVRGLGWGVEERWEGH